MVKKINKNILDEVRDPESTSDRYDINCMQFWEPLILENFLKNISERIMGSKSIND